MAALGDGATRVVGAKGVGEVAAVAAAMADADSGGDGSGERGGGRGGQTEEMPAWEAAAGRWAKRQ